MKLKRFAAAALVFCLVLTLLPGGVSAATPDSGDGWSLSADGVLTVTKNVTSVSGENWSTYWSSIKHVVIGSSVTKVSGKAFEECAELESFEVAEGNTTFSAGADGVLYSANGDEIVCYPAAASDENGRYMVPKSVVKVSKYAFAGLINSGRTLEIYAFEDTISAVEAYYQEWGDNFPNEGGITTAPYVPVTGVRLNTETLSVEVGETKTLTATVLPEGERKATFQNVSWHSQAEEFATVDDEGNVTGISAGTAKIVVTTEDGAYTASCLVTVVKKDVNGLILTPNPLTLDKKDHSTDTLTAWMTPYNATYRNISFLSTDTNVVGISADEGTVDGTTGAVTVEAKADTEHTTASAEITVAAVNPGTASIIATTADGGYYAVCKVTVLATEITKFELDNDTLELTRGPDGEKIRTLTATVEPADATYGKVSWYSSDENIVKVSGNGDTATLTTAGPGKAAVVARTEDGKQLSCAVTVWDTPTGAGVSMTELTLAPRETWDHLYAVILPATAEQDVTWSSDNTNVATVDEETGVVTAVANGTATITATSKKYNAFKAACKVTVQTSVTGVTLKDDSGEAVSSLTLDESGDNTSAMLTAVLTPGGATEKIVTFLSTDLDVVRIDSTDKVDLTAQPDATGDTASATVELTAVNPGTATIIATTKDGNHAAICTVTVNATKVTGVTLDQSAVTLGMNDTATLTATVEPESALNKGVSFDSTGSTDVIELINTGDGKTTVKPKGVGTATVKVTTNEDGKTAECTVTVVPTAVKSVKISEESLELKLGETTEETLRVEISPSDSTTPTIEWTSSTPAVAAVDETSGKVTAKSVGTALITATVTDQAGHVYTASCAVTVSPMKVTGITLEPAEISLRKSNDTETLTANLLPINATDQTITFLSTDRSVAELDYVGSGEKSETGAVTVEASEGVAKVTVKAGNPGTAYIIATTKDGGFTARRTVTVYQPVETVSIRQGPAVALDKGGTVTLSTIITPDNAPQTVTWSSDKPEIATVGEETGVVTAMAGGTATITATAADGQTASCTVTVRVPVESVTLNKTSLTVELESETADLLSLEPEVLPADATNKNVHWFSSDQAVAEVDSESGRITPKNAGTVAIIAVTDDGGKTASCTVTVRNAVTGVKLDKTSLLLMKGTSGGLIATVEPDKAYQGVEWESSAPGIATVQNGVVTAIAVGEATITATSVADPNKKATCTVTVTETVIPVRGVSLNVGTLTLNVGAKETLAPTITPSNASNQNVTWSSTNPDVATVSGGEITAMKSGTATIIVTTEDGGYMAYCVVTVNAPVTGVTLNRTEMTLSVGNTAGESLIAEVTPHDAANKNVSFNFTVTEGTNVITLPNNSGNIQKVIPLSEGKATVTVTTEDGGKTAECEVTVVSEPVDTLKISNSSLVMTPDTSITKNLTVSFHLSDSSAPAAEWSSSDPDVADVDQSGKVTAKSVGTALITAAATDQAGHVFTASCAVTVKPIPVESLAITSAPGGRLDEGDTIQLSVGVVPDNATNKDVVWHSTNEKVATVDPEGNVTAAGAGEATIVATAKYGGATDSCEVTVTGATALTLDKTELTLIWNKDDEKTASLTASLDPSLEGSVVRWESSDPAVVSVGEIGNTVDVTAISASAHPITITATVARDDGAPFTATCTVTVRTAATGLKIRQGEQEISELTLIKDSFADLTPVMTPANASNKTVTWHSLNPAVADVVKNDNGTVTVKAVTSGKTAIIATTEDGAAASCVVTVWEKIDTFTLTPDKLSLTTNETAAIAAIVTPTGANQSVEWESNEEGVATVNEHGVVTAKDPGRATITATAADGKTATCAVTVTAPVVPVTGVTLSETAMTLYTERTTTGTLTATFTPSEPTNKTLIWSSSNEDVAKVTRNTDGATVTAVTPGTATITVTTADGQYTATCTVTVEGPTVIEATGIEIRHDGAKASELTVALDKKLQLSAAVLPDNATDKTVTWSSSNEDAATVDNTGLVTPVEIGTAAITAVTANGKTATCVVTVEAAAVAVEKVTIKDDNFEMNVGEYRLLTAEVEPENATNQTVQWRSGGESFVTVDKSGIVKAEAPGTAKIYAYVGEIDSDPITVTVRTPAYSVGLSQSALTLAAQGDSSSGTRSGQLTAEVKAESGGLASNQAVTWLSSDDDIAVVTADGNGTATVTAGNKPGTATIIAVSEDGGHTAACTVTVPGIVKVIGPSSLSVGETAELTAITAPADLEGAEWTWKSDDTSKATVGNDGNITAEAAGTVTVTAKLTVGGVTVTATHAITITANEVTHIGLKPSMTIEKAGDKQTLTVTVETSGEMDSSTALNVECTSLDGGPHVVQVPDSPIEIEWDEAQTGVGTAEVEVTAQAAGTALITVSVGTCEAACVVDVPPVRVDKVRLDTNNKTLTLEDEKNNLTLTATVSAGSQDETATKQDVIWFCSDEDVAELSAKDGSEVTVTAQKPGRATITVVTLDGGHTAQCEIIVPGIDIACSETPLELYIGESAELVALPTPAGIRTVNWTWESEQNDGGEVVEVDGNGKVTAKKEGGATVTATFKVNDVEVSASRTVNVIPRALSLNKDSLALAVGHEKQLTVNRVQAVTWSSSDDSVAEVVDGLVTAKKAGTATITASTTGGIEATCTVTVSQYIFSPEVEAPTIAINEAEDGKTVTLTAASEVEIWYVIGERTEFTKYNDPFPVKENTTIKAYALHDEYYQSAVVTGFIYVSAGEVQDNSLLTDSMGNTVGSVTEALAEGSVMANVTLTKEAVEEAPDIYLAVYDTRGALIALKNYEVKLNGPGGQVISQIFDLDIPEDTKVGLIRLMVLSKDKAPVMSAGTLSG